MLYDIADQEIKVGSWIAQAYSLGRCPALKLSYVTAIKDGKVQVRGFERNVKYWADGERLTTPEVYWTRSATRSTLSFPERMIVTTALPVLLLKFIEDNFNGDPDFVDGKVKI